MLEMRWVEEERRRDEIFGGIECDTTYTTRVLQYRQTNTMFLGAKAGIAESSFGPWIVVPVVKERAVD